MKNIVFVLKPHERTSISNVINGIKSYPVNCRIDFVANELVIEIEEEGKIDEVIDFISQNYNIERVDIYVKTKGTNECVVSFGGEESVCVNGVQYNSANLKVSLDKLFKTLNLAHASTGRISNADICYYLDSCKHEMIMHFNPISKVKDIKVGDVICVNYGMHSGGENSGITFAIVCNIKENLFLLVPISNEKDITPVGYNCEFNEIEFVGKTSPKGVMLFDMARYVRSERIMYSYGKISDEYFKEIKTRLANTFNFLTE